MWMKGLGIQAWIQMLTWYPQNSVLLLLSDLLPIVLTSLSNPLHGSKIGTSSCRHTFYQVSFPDEKDLRFFLGLGLTGLTWIMCSPLNISLWSRGWNMLTGLAWVVWLNVPYQSLGIFLGWLVCLNHMDRKQRISSSQRRIRVSEFWKDTNSYLPK